MKSVLLTRSIEDNYNIIKFLEDNNLLKAHDQIGVLNKQFKYICSPLVEYKDLGVNPIILHHYNNIIITSKFATKIFIAWFNKYPDLLTSISKKNIWVVGNSSKIILSQNNFSISYIAQNIQELINNMPKNYYKDSIYLSSNEITQDLPIVITRQIIYEVKYATKLHHLEEIKKGLDYILLYSTNSAKTLINLLKDNELLELLTLSKVITISEKVADIVKSFTKNIVYCNDNKPEKILKMVYSNNLEY